MPESDLELLVTAAEAAADVARRFWRNDPKVWDKGAGEGPVTEADYAVDSLLKDMLARARPEYGWLSEETDDDPRRLHTRNVFIIDPIDGTRAFIAGNRTWAHSLAIAKEGQVTAAVVYLPMREKLYTAKKGDGARLNGNPIHASGRQTEAGSRVLAPRHAFARLFGEPAENDVERHVRASLAYRLALVAEGRFDAMVTLRDAWEWDIAAGTLLATEAGAIVKDAKLGEPRFNNPNSRLPGLLACTAGLFPQMAERITART